MEHEQWLTATKRVQVAAWATKVMADVVRDAPDYDPEYNYIVDNVVISDDEVAFDVKLGGMDTGTTYFMNVVEMNQVDATAVSEFFMYWDAEDDLGNGTNHYMHNAGQVLQVVIS